MTHPAHSDNPKDDFRRAMNLLTKGTFKNEEMVTHEFKLSEIMTAFQTLEHKPKNFIKGIAVPDYAWMTGQVLSGATLMLS